ncbi:hypothetical protein [Paenibacillus lentus]|uniref:Uncharacterized protein n=1 Tax=Paenibacillus lentus TaxID=1338368 RepID=A0A3Q8SC29_9BACL|nr:hypothetical protein [Paenibacillus lentus]AZK47217.1 hypothetical protein EIM92_14490 [Paenibacillus lentus]
MNERELNKVSTKGKNNEDNLLIWSKYILGELDEQQSKHAESLLVHDPNALEAYMAALSSLEERLPGLQQEDAFIEELMHRLPASGEAQQARGEVKRQAGKRRIREHPLFNYVIAASITLFLLSFGVFDHMTSGAYHVVPPSSEPPLSERIMEKTSGWIDQLKP